MKNRIFLIILAIILIFTGYMLYLSYIHTQPRGVVNSFLHDLLEEDHKPKSDDNDSFYGNTYSYLKYITADLKESTFLKLAFLDADIRYKISKIEDISPGKVIVWVVIIETDSNERITVPFTVIKSDNQWYIDSLPKLDIYDFGIPKLIDENEDNKTWFLEIGSKIIRLKEQPLSIVLQKDTPSSFVLLDGRVLYCRKLQPLYFSKVLSLTHQTIEDIKLGYFKIEGDFPVYGDMDGELHYLGSRAMPSGSENVALYRSRDGIGRMAVIPYKKKYSDKIRILLNNTNYTDVLHNSIRITCSDPFNVESIIDKTEYNMEAGDIIQFEAVDKGIKLIKNGSELMVSGHRWFVSTNSESRLKILDIHRTNSKNGTFYRGTLEIASAADKLCIVNEVNLEEYLYSVVPSEMPVDFGLEALKVQAVAARAYAVRSMTSNDYIPYGAHVTDSTASQVYNNIEESEIATKAVDETAGLVPFFDNQVINACFFSTSCGYTAGSHEVWSDRDGSFPSAEIPYLQATSQYPGNAPSLYNEKNFRAFINQKDLPAYDKFSPFFRWNVSLSRKQLEAVIAETLPVIFKAQPEFVLTRTSDNTFESLEIPENTGELLNIEVIKRGTGGNIMELDISTTQGTFRIIKEYNIRQILKPVNIIPGNKPAELMLHDNTSRQNFPLLPSAFAYIDFTRDIEGNIENIIINGGGYGHGVGMSQHGAYGLTLQGKSFAEIIDHYYPNCELKNIYSSDLYPNNPANNTSNIT